MGEILSKVSGNCIHCYLVITNFIIFTSFVLFCPYAVSQTPVMMIMLQHTPLCHKQIQFPRYIMA